jgi:hypothetical protein
LPGFSRANWQSTIRHYVSRHPEYSDLQVPWTGTETSDIVYDDTSGAFTRLLIDKGYLDAGVWTDATPRYYVEVKATTSASCSTRFFMSKAQYRMVWWHLICRLRYPGR